MCSLGLYAERSESGFLIFMIIVKDFVYFSRNSQKNQLRPHSSMECFHISHMCSLGPYAERSEAGF